MKRTLSVVLLGATIAMAGCQEIRNEQGGQLVGAGLGALLGSQVGDGKGQIAAAVIGGLVGAYIGGKVGRSMDRTDHYRIGQSLEGSPTGRTTSWRNPNSGIEYAMTPTATSYTANGTPCREFTTEAVIDGRMETVNGKACRQPDGTWRTI